MQMEYQAAQLKDFLTVYNTMSETCFSHCINTLNSRKLNDDEVKCVDSCVGKFLRFNHRLMQVYSNIQGEIVKKRMKEAEEENTKLSSNNKEIVHIETPSNSESNTQQTNIETTLTDTTS